MTDNPPDDAHQGELYRQIVANTEVILAGLELQRVEHTAMLGYLKELGAAYDKVDRSLDRLHETVTNSVGGLRQLFQSDHQ